MPLCQICKQREANVYFTQIVNGQKKNMYVCRQCAGAEGVKIDLNTLIAGLLGWEGSEVDNDEESVIQCDRCGMTVEEFNNSGRMGCSRCYEVFYEPMQALLTRIHGNTRHRGKIPRRLERCKEAEVQIEKLKEQLQECIKTEAYEQAAQLRDQIKFLESGKGGQPHE